MGDVEWLQAIILGIVQGATEFLPISSSAHLLLLPWLLDWESHGLIFDVLLHGGTLLAVLVFFRREWLKLGFQLYERLRGRSADLSLFPILAIGTLPALLVGGSLRWLIQDHLRTPAVTVATLSVFGIFLWWADRNKLRERSLETLGLGEALLIGVFQSMALVPGVSRSGVTITAGLLLGFSRADSARFSFLLGTPIIVLGTLDSLFELFLSGSGGGIAMPTLLIGVSSSFISGILCIKYFLRFLHIYSLTGFAVYRVALAACIFVLLVA